jgi:hypothetical protein
MWHILKGIITERVRDPLYSNHKCRRLYGKDAVSNIARTGQSVRSKYSMTSCCITQDTQPANAAECGSSSLTGTTQGTPIDNIGGT